MTNAYKYTPQGGRISIGLSIRQDKAVVAVKDTGYGIPLSEQKLIFTKFYRASNITRLDTTGTGIGLYLVKRLAEYLGGEITFKSSEKTGTVFWFSLPLPMKRQSKRS